jgi:N utilization substance protein B
MGRRTKARECAFQMLYQWSRTGEPMERVAEAFWEVRTTTEETRGNAERLARGAHDRVETIDKAIESAATHWRLERIAPVDLCIMRIATFELMADAGTPSAVVLDEAVEMARRFGEADSPAFVNGVLDRVMRDVRGAEEGDRVRRI